MSVKDYEMVIGLEIHTELKTDTKIFCGCSTEFGAEPNTHICPVCLGMPGTLPVLNKKVVELAIKAGIATDCSITENSKQDRKNYFYPDLPKAYQISQYDLPLCRDGKVEIIDDSGSPKQIRIERIHIEEDAGKLLHDVDGGSLIDLNRCGVPLIEIVSRPDMSSAGEASSYARKLRSILIYAGASDCKMNQGQMRFDVNLSVRKKGEKELGTRTETKNINSFIYMEKAISYEFKRQVALLEKGERVIQETRRYDNKKNMTFSMRSKEDAQDYRYFPDPDLAAIYTSPETIRSYKDSMPTLPDKRKKIYMDKYGITGYDAEVIAADKDIANYFEEVLSCEADAKQAVNLITGEIFSLAKKEDDGSIKIKAQDLADISIFLKENDISSSIAKKIISMLWNGDERNVKTIIEQEDMKQITDETLLKEIVRQTIAANQKAADDYKNGKQKALLSLMGQIMKTTGGKANPEITKKLLMEAIKEN